MIYVTKTYLPPLEEYVALLEQIWASSAVTNNGPMVQRLERDLALYLGVPSLRYVTNGTIAIQLALHALEIDGEVITTPFSYVATTSALLWERCSPVFADIDEHSFCIDPARVEAAITPRTQAILATHVYGYPCDVRALEAIGRRHNIKVIYDAAHAFHTRLDGRSILSFGDASTLSFHATKLFHTVEGGAVVMPSDTATRRLELLRSFGHLGDEHYLAGINGKGSELHAAMGLCVLPKIEALIAARRAVSELYDGLLAGLPLRRPRALPGVEYNYAYYPVVLPDEGSLLRVVARLGEAGVVPRRYFYPSLNCLPYHKGAPCPVSEDIARRVLCLPLAHHLTPLEVRPIAEVLAQCLRESPR